LYIIFRFIFVHALICIYEIPDPFILVYLSLSYEYSGEDELWTLYIHFKNGLPNHEYIRLKLERASLNFTVLSRVKDQTRYNVRDYLYYKKRCGGDLATLEPIDYVKQIDNMIQDNIMEKEIRLVLTKQPETTNQVSITPMK